MALVYPDFNYEGGYELGGYNMGGALPKKVQKGRQDYLALLDMIKQCGVSKPRGVYDNLKAMSGMTATELVHSPHLSRMISDAVGGKFTGNQRALRGKQDFFSLEKRIEKLGAKKGKVRTTYNKLKKSTGKTATQLQRMRKLGPSGLNALIKKALKGGRKLSAAQLENKLLKGMEGGFSFSDVWDVVKTVAPIVAPLLLA